MLRFVGLLVIAFACLGIFEQASFFLSAQSKKNAPPLNEKELLPPPREAKEPAAKGKDAKKGKEPTATPAASLKVAKGFKVELLYSVPKDEQGSWVCMCVDPKGRLIVSDQYGGLFRVTPPAIGGKESDTKVEKIPAKIGEAQGLLWAFDSLYVVVNKGAKYDSGLYCVTSSKNDDVLDKVELLKKIDGTGEHGPHAVLLTPGGKSLTVVCGDATKMVDLAGSRVPKHWGEDHLLPRMPDGRGFMAGVLGPGGCIYKVDPEGKNWELLSTGYRNEYDAAYNKAGDLFTYDADMEWDFNTPWYRPTRICLAASGSEFGWRNGAGKWPPYYADSWPAIYDIGPGSPTGMTFGYGANFPPKYENALFACDWSYGKLYAVHLTPFQSTYKAEVEEFISGSPLPLTDIVVNPKDGAMYFAIGGRKVKSGLYRVTYVEPERSTGVVEPEEENMAHRQRKALEAFHGKQDPKAVATAWPYLSSDDRFLRSAARVAIEWQDPKTWMKKAFAETNTQAQLEALLALVRVTSDDPQHKKTEVDDNLKFRILHTLQKIEWAKLDDFQKLQLLRIYSILFVRMGPPDDELKQQIIARFDAVYPFKIPVGKGEQTGSRANDLAKLNEIANLKSEIKNQERETEALEVKIQELGKKIKDISEAKDAAKGAPSSEEAKLLFLMRQIKSDQLKRKQDTESLQKRRKDLENQINARDDLANAKPADVLETVYHSKSRFINGDLCQLLVYLQAPGVAGKTLKLMAEAPTQEEQMEYAKSLRMLKTGWSHEQRQEYFKWFLKAANFKGGNSFGGFMENIKRDAVATLTDKEKAALKPILEAKPDSKLIASGPPRPLYKQYKIEDVKALVENGLANRDFDNGRKLFGIANCFSCHRFDNEGGAHGPDLSQAAGRFSVHDLLEKVVNPSKAISDQYAAVNIEMLDGRKITGRIINLHGDNMTIMPNMLEPNKTIDVDRRKVETMQLSKLSLMPTGLLDTLKEDEVLDLVAYLLSRGDRGNKMFKK